LNGPLDELYRRPGFLIRRANQIAVALFLEETGALGITNSQYGILLVLKHHPGIDQISVAKVLGLDRSTTGMVLDKLEKAGLIGRSIGTHDKRRRTLALTRAGERMLERLAEPEARRHRAGDPSEDRRELVGRHGDSVVTPRRRRPGRRTAGDGPHSPLAPSGDGPQSPLAERTSPRRG